MLHGFALLALTAAPWSPVQAAPVPGAAAEPPLERVALVDALVHDFSSDAEPRRATVLIEGDTIVAIETDLTLEPGVLRVDAAGLHLTPGLIDGLASMDPDHDALYVAHGVTTVCDPGADVALIEAMRQPYIRDAVPGPQLLSAGATFDGDPPTSAVAVVVQDPVTVAPLVDTLVERIGVEYLSAQPGLGEAGLEALVEAGRTHGLGVWSQGVAGVSFEKAVEIGQAGFYGLNSLLPDGVQWGFVMPTAFRPRIELAATAGVAMMPMLGVHKRLTAGSAEDPRTELLSPDYEALWAAESSRRAQLLNDEAFVVDADRVGRKLARLTRDLHKAGVSLVPASSAPLGGAFPGASLIDELAEWVSAGFTRREALDAATRGAARVFGLERRGQVAVGMVADLVLLESDPRESLSGYHKPAAVVVRGRVLDRYALDDLLEAVRISQQQLREELARPLEIPPPAVPEGAALLMSGQVETKALGSRLSSEAWTAFRMPTGAIHFRGRLLAPSVGRVSGIQMEIEQIVVDGRLTAFALEAKVGEDVLLVEGIYDSSRFRMRRTMNGNPVDTRTLTQRPEAIHFTPLADSVTSAFVIGQRKRNGPMSVIAFGDFFEPIEQLWSIDVGVGRERLVRTAQGVMTLRYGAQGELVEWGRIAGQALTATRPVRYSDFGGGGLPVAFDPGATPDGFDPSLPWAVGSKGTVEAGAATTPPTEGAEQNVGPAPVGPPSSDG
ncbi:MAG: amidohydrolase family protein [Planctomycetota bacterium]|jgi:hypothetical protein